MMCFSLFHQIFLTFKESCYLILVLQIDHVFLVALLHISWKHAIKIITYDCHSYCIYEKITDKHIQYHQYHYYYQLKFCKIINAISANHKTLQTFLHTNLHSAAYATRKSIPAFLSRFGTTQCSLLTIIIPQNKKFHCIFLKNSKISVTCSINSAWQSSCILLYLIKL